MALLSFASLGLLDPTLIVFLLVFFFIAYLTVGAFMAAIGSAVNDMREAQGLMTPVMLVIMVPWFLWMPISRDPNSPFATVAELRAAGEQFRHDAADGVGRRRRPSGRRSLASCAGAAGVVAALWFAGKSSGSGC